MTNIAVVEGVVTLIGYSAKKKGTVFSVETDRGPVRCFMEGPEGMTVPQSIAIKGHIRSETYDDEILEEVFVEMYSETSVNSNMAISPAGKGHPTEDGGWEDIPPALPGEESEI